MDDYPRNPNGQNTQNTKKFLHPVHLCDLFATCERSSPSLLFWSLIQTELLPRSHTFLSDTTWRKHFAGTAHPGSKDQSEHRLSTKHVPLLSATTPSLAFPTWRTFKVPTLLFASLKPLPHQTQANCLGFLSARPLPLPRPSYLLYDYGVISRFWCRYDTNFHCAFLQLHIFMLPPQPLHRHGQPSKPSSLEEKHLMGIRPAEPGEPCSLRPNVSNWGSQRHSLGTFLD